MAISPKAAGREKKKQAYHHGDLRAALMRVALELIEAHGVKGFTLKDAARMAGVSIAAPYRHFADKDALLGAIVGEGFAQFDAALRGAYERGRDAHERIVELGVAYVLFALEHPAHFRVMFGRAPGSDQKHDPEEGTGFVLLVRGVAELMPESTDDARRDMVLACWSVVHGFTLLQLEGAIEATMGYMDVEVQLRRTLRVIMVGKAAESEAGGGG